METFEERAARRRSTWQGDVVGLNHDSAGEERKYWSTTSASERLDAVWEMALEAWAMKKGAEPAPRLQGSPVGIRKRRG